MFTMYDDKKQKFPIKIWLNNQTQVAMAIKKLKTIPVL